MRQLGVTRTAEELAGLEQRARERGFSLVALPLLETQALNFTWPPDPNLNTDDWLVFTSARGVRFFFSMLAKKGTRLDSGLRIAAVGPRTEEALREFGLRADFIPQTVGGEGLYREFIETFVRQTDRVFSVAYISAETPRFDPERLFESTAIRYRRIPVYRSLEKELAKDSVTKFTSEDIILYTSPLAAESYARQFGAPVARPVAIGQTTAQAIRNLGWPEAEVLAHPDISAALELVET
jgi:uroporphyrinogen-III synthase